MFPRKSLLDNSFHVKISSNCRFARRSLSLLADLAPPYNSTKEIRRVGRGPSSGRGKTSGRGQKGQKARGSVKPWFEGGQTPLHKLLPKVGFRNTYAIDYTPVNLGTIARSIETGRLQLEEGEVLTIKKMRQAGILSGSVPDAVKILSHGKESLTVPLKIEANKASAKAIEHIESIGGEFTARYMTRLGIRTQLNPLRYFDKYGHLPLPARPRRRKDIEYYSNPEKRGYLIKENHPLLQAINAAKGVTEVKRKAKTSVLEKVLDEAKAQLLSADGYKKSGVISLKDLHL